MTVEARILPVLLLQGKQLVKTRRFADPVYVGDPVNVLSIFNDFEVDEIVLLDIGGAHRRSPADFQQLRRYAEECFIPLAYGGGLTSVEQIASLFKAGYEKAILNTAVVEAPGLIRQAVDRFGSQAIVASADVAGSGAHYEVLTKGGTVRTGLSPVAWAEHATALGVGEILITSIDQEGTAEGFDLELVQMITDTVNIPVIAHGGAGKRKHLNDPIRTAGASAAAAGGLFVFQGNRTGVLVNFPARAQVERLIATN